MSVTEYFFTYDFATGGEQWKGTGPIGIAAQQNLPAGVGIVIVSETEYAGLLANVPLATLQLALWNNVKARRDKIIDAGAPTPSGVVDSNDLSRTNITGATLGALIAQVNSQPFTMDWTLRDNSVVTLNAAQMLAMGMAVLSYVGTAHGRARALRTEIEGVADVPTLLQIDYTAGWPS